jgi:hypothetical protein
MRVATGLDILCYGHAGPAFLSKDDGRTWKVADIDEKGLTITHSPITELFDGEFLCVPMPIGFRPSELPAKLLQNPGLGLPILDLIRVALAVQEIRDPFVEMNDLDTTHRRRRQQLPKVIRDVCGEIPGERG